MSGVGRANWTLVYGSLRAALAGRRGRELAHSVATWRSHDARL